MNRRLEMENRAKPKSGAAVGSSDLLGGMFELLIKLHLCDVPSANQCEQHRKQKSCNESGGASEPEPTGCGIVTAE